MKKNDCIRRIITALFVGALALTMSLMLFACNRKSPDIENNSRAETKVEFVETVLSATDINWTSDMSDVELAALNNCGDYVITLYWTEFVADILEDSSMQTAKIQRLTDTLKSDDGQAFIADPRNKAGNLISLIQDVGFTADDVKGLVYDGILAFLNDAENVLGKCEERLNALRAIPQNADARNNLNKAISQNKDSKESFNSVGTSATDIKTAVVEAEDGLKTLIEFFYNAALLFDDEGEMNFFETLSSGALENVTLSEAATYVGSILNSVTELKNGLTPSELSAVENALGLILDKTDGIAVVSSNAYNAAIKYMRYAQSFIGILPAMCTLIEDAGKGLLLDQDGDYPALSNLLLAAFDENYYKTETSENIKLYYKYNLAISASRALLDAVGVDYAEQDAAALAADKIAARDYVKSIFNSIAYSADSYKRKMVIAYITVLVKPDADSEIYETAMDFALKYEVMIALFKTAYAQYIGGDTSKVSVMNDYITGNFKEINVQGISTTNNPTSEWYSKVLNAVISRINDLFGENVSPAEGSAPSNLYMMTSFVNSRIDEFFASTIDDFITLANMSVVKADSQEFDALRDKLAAMGIKELFEHEVHSQA